VIAVCGTFQCVCNPEVPETCLAILSDQDVTLDVPSVNIDSLIPCFAYRCDSTVEDT
jgi:hypothetical protein